MGGNVQNLGPFWRLTVARRLDPGPLVAVPALEVILRAVMRMQSFLGVVFRSKIGVSMSSHRDPS